MRKLYDVVRCTGMQDFEVEKLCSGWLKHNKCHSFTICSSSTRPGLHPVSLLQVAQHAGSAHKPRCPDLASLWRIKADCLQQRCVSLPRMMFGDTWQESGTAKILQDSEKLRTAEAFQNAGETARPFKQRPVCPNNPDTRFEAATPLCAAASELPSPRQAELGTALAGGAAHPAKDGTCLSRAKPLIPHPPLSLETLNTCTKTEAGAKGVPWPLLPSPRWRSRSHPTCNTTYRQTSNLKSQTS